jgi:hypothetical protein
LGVAVVTQCVQVIFTSQVMSMKVAIFAIRVVVLIALHFISFVLIAAVLLPPPAGEVTPADGSAAVNALLFVSILNTTVIIYILSRSRYAGWNLVLATFVVFYGAMTVMPQIETAFFVNLPTGMLSRLFLSGAVFALVFSLLAVLVLGKTKAETYTNKNHSLLNMAASEWLLKLSVIVICYLILYFTFGYFIAWRSEAVRAYYGGNDPGSFFAQMNTVLHDTPWLIPLQVLRAILWTGIAIVVVRTMKGRWWQAALAVALLFSVMTAQLLIPNPLMPREVRMVHLLETASSNFIFGWVIVMVLLAWKPSAKTSEKFAA